ncbi:MAG TPA: lytic transglycosylase domain-containing protein, partial [Burkholderiaceae bacterium]|nr:lytic transglycosylase domain-containing protein [Burkholderiaceae bacterium]
SIESAMNPFAQSPVGAQGLMQIMPTVHAEKLVAFGGPSAALHPITNIRVGAGILKEYIQRFGSTEDGLKAYVGSALQEHDNGYGARVMGERARIEAAVRKFAAASSQRAGMRPTSAPTVMRMESKSPAI